MDKKLFQMAKARERERAIEDGFYDGRYRPKVYKDKKKEEKKYKNRRYFDDIDE